MLGWEDEQGRSWSSEPLYADTPHDARNRHAMSMSGGWVTEDMRRPYVSPLMVAQNGRSATVAPGGDVPVASQGAL